MCGPVEESVNGIENGIRRFERNTGVFGQGDTITSYLFQGQRPSLLIVLEHVEYDCSDQEGYQYQDNEQNAPGKCFRLIMCGVIHIYAMPITKTALARGPERV